MAPDFVTCNPQDSHVRSVRYDPLWVFLSRHASKYRVFRRVQNKANCKHTQNNRAIWRLAHRKQAKCEHIKCMSPFLTCFPRLLSAKPFGWGHTHRAHIKRRRLIMPLVALVQKKQSAPATAYKIWCDAIDFVAIAIPSLRSLRRSLPRRRCSSHSVFERVSACIRTHRTSKVRSSSYHNCERSEQYHLPEANITAAGNITDVVNITERRLVSSRLSHA